MTKIRTNLTTSATAIAIAIGSALLGVVAARSSGTAPYPSEASAVLGSALALLTLLGPVAVRVEPIVPALVPSIAGG